MASKAYRKKHVVKELKQEKAVQRDAHHKKTKTKKVISYVVLSVLVVVLAYFWISSSINVKIMVPQIDDAPSTGPADASVTFLEFGCFTCPYTKNFNLNVLPELMNEYDGKVNFVFKHVPIARNIGSDLAAQASQCANDQNKFWEYARLLFNGGSSYTIFELKEYANSINLDRVVFDECLDSGKYVEKVNGNSAEGKELRISITPTVYLNGVRIEGFHEAAVYRNIIDDMLSKS